MKKILLVIFSAFTMLGYAQQKQNNPEKKKTETPIKKEKSDFWKNVQFGGGVGFNFGNGSTTLSLNPTAIYQFNEKFALGGSIGYRFSRLDDFRSNVYSASTLGLYNPIEQLQFSSEFEYSFARQRINNDRRNFNFPALYLGVAYRIANFSSIGIRYDVLFNEDRSVFRSAFTPIIRVFF